MEMIQKQVVKNKVLYDGLAITKKDAKHQGLKRYFDPSRVCFRHHIAQRYVSSGACVECSKMRAKNGSIGSNPKLSITDYCRSIVAAKGNKGFTIKSIESELKAVGKHLNEGQIRQYVSRAATDGEVKSSNKKAGRYIVYKPGLKFYENNIRHKDMFKKINKGKHIDIEINFDKSVKEIDGAVKTVKKEMEIKKQEEDIPDFQLEETGAALVGASIISYINHLKNVKNYEAYNKKISSLEQNVRSLQEKYDHAVKQNQILSEKYNDLQRQFYDQKSELKNSLTHLTDLKDLIKRRKSDVFSIGEVAKITKTVDGNLNLDI